MNGTPEKKMSENAPGASHTIGMCQCGCGKPAPIAKQSNTKRGHVRGLPIRFITHHHLKVSNPNNKGGLVLSKGHILVRIRNKSSYYPFHRVLVENVLGKELPVKAVVHHSDGDRSNNTLSNIVACEDNTYHMLLHKRKRAHDACGHAGWLRCKFCKDYDNPKNMYVPSNLRSAYHRKCGAEYARNRRLLND